MPTSSRHQLLQRQHQGLAPILNDPFLLVDHVLAFFGPEGPEPLLTEPERQAAHALLKERCHCWVHSCQARQVVPLLDREPVFCEAMTEEELARAVARILALLGDGDSLLALLAQTFGPTAPPHLAIDNARHWRFLKALFQGRLDAAISQPWAPSTSGIPRPHWMDAEAHAGFGGGAQFQPQEVIVAEVVMDEEGAAGAAPPAEGEEGGGLSATQLALFIGGGLVLFGLARALAGSAGARAVGEALPALSGGIGRRVFTGPRGGRFLITSTGTKSYCVP